MLTITVIDMHDATYQKEKVISMMQYHTEYSHSYARKLNSL